MAQVCKFMLAFVARPSCEYRSRAVAVLSKAAAPQLALAGPGKRCTHSPHVKSSSQLYVSRDGKAAQNLYGSMHNATQQRSQANNMYVSLCSRGDASSGLEANPGFRPLLTTVPEPDYPSGHATLSAVAEAVLRK